MKYIKEIVPYVKIFLFAYLVIMTLPIHHATGLNIQSHIQWAIFGCMQHNNLIYVVIRTIIALLFIVAYQTKDAMLFCLLLFCLLEFIFGSSLLIGAPTSSGVFILLLKFFGLGLFVF